MSIQQSLQVFGAENDQNRLPTFLTFKIYLAFANTSEWLDLSTPAYESPSWFSDFACFVVSERSNGPVEHISYRPWTENLLKHYRLKMTVIGSIDCKFRRNHLLEALISVHQRKWGCQYSNIGRNPRILIRDQISPPSEESFHINLPKVLNRSFY